jgi:ParB-like chromosome segregation protein Spo0J
VPVLTDPNGEVIDGAVRVEAARLMGLPQVPCIVAAHLTKAEVRTHFALTAPKSWANGASTI